MIGKGRPGRATAARSVLDQPQRLNMQQDRKDDARQF
jgi:hypothetical protein